MYFLFMLKIDAYGEVEDQRCVGYYKHYDTAKHHMMKNHCDIFEMGYYQYAVINEIKPGIYPEVNELQWFVYDDERVFTLNDRPVELEPHWRRYLIG